MKAACSSRRTGRLAAFALAGAAVFGASPALAEDVPSKLGPDFQVNTFTLGNQDSPDVARYADGRFVVVWQDFTNSRVKARLYLASGAPAGGEVEVSEAGLIVSPPHVAALADGGFAVVWGVFHDVLLRRFDREARPLGSAVVVNGSHPDLNLRPDIAADSGGNLAIVWYRDGFFDDLVLLRRFDAAGNPQGDPFQVNSFTNRRPSAAHVAMNDAGSILVSWNEDVGFRVLARRFDGPSGTWANEVRIQAPGGGHPANSVPLLYREGDGAVVFSDLRFVDIGVFAQPLDAEGALMGAAAELGGPLYDTSALAAATGAAGNTFVVWSQLDNNGSRLFGRLFNRSWQPLGEALAVSADPLNLKADDLQPAVAADAFGGFVTVWSNGGRPTFFPILLPPQILDGRDGSLFGVFGQLLGDPECAADSEVLCLGEGNRFRVRAKWRNPFTGETGNGHARRLTADTGALWFFGPSNLEVMIKVLDGRPVNGRFWFFLGSLSNVEYMISVTDTATGKEKAYHNPPFQFSSLADTSAFADSAPASSSAAAVVAAAALPEPATSPQSAGCTASAESLCLAAARFQVQVDFVDPRTGAAGHGRALPLTADTGVFWFFAANNLELMIKVLDGRPVNGRFWVFFGALSDVEYTITVMDTETGEKRIYVNPRGQLASRADTDAFPLAGH
jgi:hypothetical protein